MPYPNTPDYSTRVKLILEAPNSVRDCCLKTTTVVVFSIVILTEVHK